MSYFEQTTMFAPTRGSEVDYDKETVEGRVGKLLETDERGNYQHQFVRQAQDRQQQAFNARGLLNSSMAMQAAQEAAISKAAEVAAPDAKTYYDNRRGNIEQGMQVRKSYQTALESIATNYQRQLDTINASSMEPGDKDVAVRQASSVRDGEIAFQNNLFNRMPDWRSEWLSAAVPTAGLDINGVGNEDTLSNIANDPGQSQQMREQATQRLQAMRSGQAGMIGGAGPSAGQASNGYNFPVAVGGQVVDWDQRGSGLMRGTTLRQRYEQYAQQAGRAAMSPDEWYRQQFGRSVEGGLGSDSNGDAAPGAASGGDDGGVSI
jgi:hypothetical protein